MFSKTSGMFFVAGLSILTAFPTLLYAGATSIPESILPGRPKALVIMLDGVRADVLDDAAMPNLAGLRSGIWQSGYRGAYSDCAQPIQDAQPNSAPNHVAIATGVSATKNLVWNNGETGKGDYEAYPHVLSYLEALNPDLSTVYLYVWGESGQIRSKGDVQYINVADEDIAAAAAEQIRSGADALYVYIDAPDHGGHGENFYPHSPFYLRQVANCDRWIGTMLEAISSRPEFEEENWLILVTADHGGYHRNHGMRGGHATTIPIIMAGKSIQEGKIAGVPGNVDVPVTMLDHFGINVKDYQFDGKVLGLETVPAGDQSLSAELAVYLPFDDAEVIDRGSNTVMTVSGDVSSGDALGIFGNSATFTGNSAFITLNGTEKLALRNGKEFTAAMWVKTTAEQSGDAPVLSNKDWRDGTTPGFVISSNTVVDGTGPGYAFNVKRNDDRKRTDLGAFDTVQGEWTFLAVSVDANGAVYFAEGRPDGRFYFLADDAASMVVANGVPWRIGQDGTGKYPCSFNGQIDDFAVWTRGLSIEELRRIYEAGRKGVSLGDMLEQ